MQCPRRAPTDPAPCLKAHRRAGRRRNRNHGVHHHTDQPRHAPQGINRRPRPHAPGRSDTTDRSGTRPPARPGRHAARAARPGRAIRGRVSRHLHAQARGNRRAAVRARDDASGRRARTVPRDGSPGRGPRADRGVRTRPDQSGGPARGCAPGAQACVRRAHGHQPGQHPRRDERRLRAGAACRAGPRPRDQRGRERRKRKGGLR